MLTYKNGLKILTLSILEQNSIFVESLTDDCISFGIINSAANSINNYQLRKKLDYAVSFACTLGLEVYISIHTAERRKRIIEKRLDKLNAPFSLPSITIKAIPERTPTRTEYLKQLLEIV